LSAPRRSPDRYHRIAELIASQGWGVEHNFLDPRQVAALAGEAWQLWRDGGFRHAGVGVGVERKVRPEVRQDQVHWLDPDHLSAAQQVYFAQLESLRLELNQRLFLGLFGFEGHLAVYPVGAYYRKHLDQFAAVRHRQVSCILYLNHAWRERDGGQLRLYLGADGEGGYVDVGPTGGTLVCFLSANVWHEVLPAGRERLSLTGWFRRRG
jgi:SM-20-related protein